MKKQRKYSKALWNFSYNFRQISRVMHALIFAYEHLKILEDKKPIKISKDKFNKHGRDILMLANDFDEALEFLNNWQLVMMVTFVETYLQDVLSDAAKEDASIIKDSKISASYEEVISSSSLEALADDIRYKWASRNFITCGPTKWIERLRQMGAKNLSSVLAKPMEEIWGIRHLIVHNSGIVTREFIRIHPHCKSKVGNEYNVSSKSINRYCTVLYTFIIQTDAYLLQRFPSLAYDFPLPKYDY
jgi:hypothetical protein